MCCRERVGTGDNVWERGDERVGEKIYMRERVEAIEGKMERMSSCRFWASRRKGIGYMRL